MPPPQGGRSSSSSHRQYGASGRGRARGAQYRRASRTSSVQLSRTQQEMVSQVLAAAAPAPAWSRECDAARSAAATRRTSPPVRTPSDVQQQGRELQAAFEAQRKSPAWLQMQPGRQSLPALAARDSLLHTIAASDVTVVAGGTGCGKSTQVPQFLLDEMLSSGRGGCASIVCTQPRRIAAVGVAERVAEERGERIGRSVGYSIRGESKRSSASRLIFCTTGILLRMLEEDHDLATVTHLIIDEVHERSCDSDLLLLMCRQMLARFKSQKPSPLSSAVSGLKVVLMSATLDSAVFVKYFKQVGLKRTFPVERLYLSDAIEHCGYDCRGSSFCRSEVTPAMLSKRNGTNGVTDAGADDEPGGAEVDGSGMSAATQKIVAANRQARLQKEKNVSDNSASGRGTLGGSVHAWCDRVGQEGMLREQSAGLEASTCSERTLDVLRSLDQNHTPSNVDLVLRLVRYIASQPQPTADRALPAGKRSGGAILVFLPGLGEINTMLRAMQNDQELGKADHYLVLPLHSELSTAEQKKVFCHARDGITKVVLSTNIAEASITIDDVCSVIDCGTHKEMQYDPYTSMAALVQTRISCANAAQRAGRAGRVRAGRCYHLFMKWEEENVMSPQQLPEIQRSPLETTCLRIKMLGLGSIAAALAQAPEPPAAHAVDHVLKVLSGLGFTRQLATSTTTSEPEPQNEGESAPASEGASEVEVLTALGVAVASLPVDPRIGKLAILGAVFRCLEPTLILAASLATRSPFLSPFAKRDEAASAKRRIDDWSDHMALLAAYRGWKDSRPQRQFADENFLSHQTMQLISVSIDQFKSHLKAQNLYTTKSAEEIAKCDEYANNLPLVRSLLVAALYPNIATVTASTKRQESVLAREGSSPKSIPVEIRTVDLWSRKSVRKASTDELNDRAVKLHPSSVLCAQRKLGALVVQWQSKHDLFLVFHGRIKTSQVFICDASIVGPMPILLFAGTVDSNYDKNTTCMVEKEQAKASGCSGNSVRQSAVDVDLHAEESSKSDQDPDSGAAQVVLEIDGWLRFATGARQAHLFTGLRRCIGALLQSKLATHDQLDGATEDNIVAAVANIIQESDCGAGAFEKTLPLPAGWESIEDPSSSTGRVFFRNRLSGETQRERPTRPASAAKKEPGARLPPPTLTPPLKPRAQTEAEKQAMAEKSARLATARTEAKARQAEDAEEEASQARLASIRLATEAEQREREGKAKNGVRVLSVATLLNKLDLEHYTDGFAAAGIDDDALAEIIAIINDDPEVGAVEVDRLIDEVGVRGGAAVKIRRALSKPDKHGKSGGGRGDGAVKGRGNKLSKKDQASLAAAEKRAKTAAAKATGKMQAAQKAALLQASKQFDKKTAGKRKIHKTCAEISDADNPRVVAQAVARALKLPVAETSLPKDVLALASASMPEVDLGDLAPKSALLVLAKAILTSGK